jgi:phosphate:Na+ symporter
MLTVTDELWIMAVRANPINVAKNGFFRDISGLTTCGSFFMFAIAWDMVLRPTNRIPKPTTTSATLRTFSFFVNIITDYLVKINQTTLPIEDLNSLGALFHVVNDIERIGDHAENVADTARQRKEEGVSISKEAQKELGDMLEMVNKIIRYAVEMFAKSDESHMQEIVTLEDQVDEKERELQKKHVERLTKGECSPEAGMIFSDIVSGLERVADHATNIAFAITTEEDAEDGDIKR